MSLETHVPGHRPLLDGVTDQQFQVLRSMDPQPGADADSGVYPDSLVESLRETAQRPSEEPAEDRRGPPDQDQDNAEFVHGSTGETQGVTALYCRGSTDKQSLARQRQLTSDYETALVIIDELDEGMSKSHLARRAGVSRMTISRIDRNRDRYVHSEIDQHSPD